MPDDVSSVHAAAFRPLIVVLVKHLVFFVLFFPIDFAVFLAFGTQMRLPGAFRADSAQ